MPFGGWFGLLIFGLVDLLNYFPFYLIYDDMIVVLELFRFEFEPSKQ